jgi:hypothetical protein
LADQRITQLTALPKASVAATDVLPIADISASQTKKVTAKDLVDAGLDLIDLASIDLDKLNQSSTTKLGTTSLADDAITAAKLGEDSTIFVGSTAPTTDNYEGRGWLNSTNDALSIYKAGAYVPLQVRAENIPASQIGTSELADGAVTTAKASNLGTAALADDAVTYAKIQNTTGSNLLLGRSTAGAGIVERSPAPRKAARCSMMPTLPPSAPRWGWARSPRSRALSLEPSPAPARAPTPATRPSPSQAMSRARAPDRSRPRSPAAPWSRPSSARAPSLPARWLMTPLPRPSSPTVRPPWWPPAPPQDPAPLSASSGLTPPPRSNTPGTAPAGCGRPR